MGQAVVKTTRDRDMYIVWSSIVDAPVYVGDRAAMVQYVQQEWRLDADRAEAALVRADTEGTSDRAIKFGHWDDDYLPVMEGSPRDGWYHIARDRLSAYADALLAGDEPAATALLECYRRHDEDDDT